MAYSKQQFIEKANKIHNNFYNYEKTIFIGVKNKNIITCPEHGDFEQTPDNHLQGQGCRLCANKKISTSKLHNKNIFIEKARLIHSDKFDYSKVIYINSLIKITITCREHGDFEQIPDYHLQGAGCPKCKSEKISKLNISTKEEFIEKSKNIHNNKYDYSKVKYIKSKIKVIIICPEHGEFEQTPFAHIQGQGCSTCKASKGEQALEEIFKKHNIKYEPQYNIPEIVANYQIDFYLPEYRLLVEFHGIQHYEYIPFFHDGNYTFEDQKSRDTMVRDVATRFKYNYLEFNYKQLKYMTVDEFEYLIINKINNLTKKIRNFI